MFNLVIIITDFPVRYLVVGNISCFLYFTVSFFDLAECTVMGIPSISTNLSVTLVALWSNTFKILHLYGIYIIDRHFKSPEESVQQLTQVVNNFNLFIYILHTIYL